ncbi:MAG: endonuclease/exonuclease/phosphatase family protein [Pirellulales bacterium]
MREAHAPSRRTFLSQAAGAVLTAPWLASSVFAQPATNAKDASKPTQLRVIAYNVYVCTGWPKERALAKKTVAAGQFPERFANELALYEPDLINFSESPKEDVVKRIAERLKMNYVMFPSGEKWPGALLTKYDILESQAAPIPAELASKDLFTRHWGRAVVRLPDDSRLIVHSAHLHPSKDDLRKEIDAMLKSMSADLKADKSMLLLGDLNHEPKPPEYPQWTAAGWIDTFAKVGQGEGLTIKSDVPEKRIDFVLAAGPIAKTVVESRPLFEGAFRVNVNDPESFALSDHLPQLAVFKSGE